MSDEPVVPGSRPAVPRAARATRAAWRDVRLWLGVALVALSVVGGSRLLAAADETVTVWRATEDLQPGLPLDPDALTRTRVHLADDSRAEHYLRAGGATPTGDVLRAVGAGELVPVGAVGTAAESLTTVSMELPSAQVPGHVQPGSRVDLWIRPTTDDEGTTARRLVPGVLVLEAPEPDGLGGVAATRQIVVGLAPETADEDLQRLMEAIGTARVMVSGVTVP